jgi:pilus assembly protein Flp/PilA
MKNLMQGTQRFMRDEEGAVAIEYGLLAVLIALGIATGAGLLGGGLSTLFTNVSSCFDGAAGGTCPVTLPNPL